MKKIIGVVLLLIVLIPLGFILFRKNNISERDFVVEKYETPNSHFFSWNGQEYHYTKQGSGEDTILMIHGFGGSFRNFTEFAIELEDQFVIYAIDLPSFGLSEVPDLETKPKDMMLFHEEYFTAFSQEISLDSFHLVGNSMGGMISWYLASRNPKVKTLCLLNSAGYGMAEVKETATGWMTSAWGRWLFKKGVPISMYKSNAERCLYNEDLLTEDNYMASYYINNKEGTFDWMLDLATSEVLPDTSLIQTITTPTLVVWGDDDQIVPKEHAYKFERDLPNGTLLMYKNCGHVPQIEYPEELAKDWVKFVNSLK